MRDKVRALSKGIKTITDKAQISLTERQMKIVEKIVEKGSMSNREFRDLFRISDEAMRKELSKLLALGVVKTTGKGRSLKYDLA